MDDEDLDVRAEIHVREHPLPGSARLFWLKLSDGTVVSVAIHAVDTRREVSLTLPGHDRAALTVELSDAEATTLAALLSGVRFVVETPSDQAPAGAAGLTTLTLGTASPAVGAGLGEIDVPAPEDARVIAVIRDDTPELVEEDARQPCRPGDRLVLVGRPRALAELVQYLLG